MLTMFTAPTQHPRHKEACLFFFQEESVTGEQ